MKFNIDNDILTRKVKLLSKVLPAKPSNNNFNCILFRKDGNEMTATAGDGDTECTVRLLPASVEGDAPIAVPGDLLRNAIETIGGQPVTLEPDGNSIRLTWATGRITLPAFDPDEYPARGTIEECNGFDVQADVMAMAIQKTAYCTADDDLRPSLNGIRVDVQEERLTVAGTDQRILTIYDIEMKSPQPFAFLLSNKMTSVASSVIDAVLKEAKDAKSEVIPSIRFYTGTRHYGFRVEGYEVSGVLSQGKYPQYRQVVPKNNDNVLTVDRKELIGVLQRMSVISSGRTSGGAGTVKLDLQAIGTAEISAQDLNIKAAARETLENARYEGSDLSVAFNIDYLLSLLKHRTADKISLRLSSGSSPVLFEDAEQEGVSPEPLTSVMVTTRVQQ